jgi:hypothetical protein
MPAQSVGPAWIALCLALALYVIDEALAGFLDVYNRSVWGLHERWPWLPLPVFTFEKWIVGLVQAIPYTACMIGLRRKRSTLGESARVRVSGSADCERPPAELWVRSRFLDPFPVFIRPLFFSSLLSTC